MIVDSHCHLNEEKYAGIDTPETLIARAKAANVGILQTICTQISEFDEIHQIALKHENVYCSVGVHPHHAGEEPLTFDMLAERAQKEKVIGIGETGLDYYYDNAPRDKQAESFKLHLDVARELDMPVIIHNRESDADCMAILSEELKKGPLKLLFHCFSSSLELAEFAVENKIFLSASGIITFKKADEAREAFKRAPLDLLLVETDSPYLAPEPHRGKINEPAYTVHVLEKLAEIKGISANELEEVTTRNFKRLFDRVV